VLAPVLAGCGGGDDSTSETSTATAPATTREQNERLTPAAWADYEDVAAEARTVNSKAIATFKTCRRLIYGSEERANASECFGDSLTNLVTVGKSTLTFLEGGQADVAGACAKANAELTGYVKLYVASAQSLSNSVDEDEIAAAQPTVDNALTALKRARAADVAFVAACEPTGSA